MRIASPTFRIAAGLLLAVLLSFVGYQVFRQSSYYAPEALLKQADEMSWLNSWIEAEPLYRQAEQEFTQRHQLSKALYARVSQMPAHSESSTSIPSQIAVLRQDLDLPEAKDPETRLRVLTILGMFEVNYDSGMARETWTEVATLANRQHHYLLAARAMGEQGVAAFLLGDLATAKKNVVKAWTIAKVADPGAHIRYASLYGAGLVEMHKYQEALGPLDEAIKVAGKTRGAAYPTIAVNAKIDALSGLGENKEALALAAEELRRVSVYRRHTYDDKASCNRQSTAQAKLWTRQVLKNLQHGYAVKGLGIKCQVLGVHAHDTQALHSSGTHRKKVSDSSFALFDGGYREVGQAGQQWPEKRASPTAEIQKILRRKPSQHPEYSLHSGQFRIPFELVEPKPGFQSIVDSGRGVAEPASNECGRQISEIGFHRLSRIAVQSLFYSACVILSQVSSNRDRYLRRRSASFALALRVRELLKSRRPASDSDRQRRQAATTCSS